MSVQEGAFQRVSAAQPRLESRFEAEVGGGEKPLQAAEQQLTISLPQISKDASKYYSLGIRIDPKTDIK